MTNVKTLTNASALAMASETVRAIIADDPTAIADMCDKWGVSFVELAEKLDHMHEQATKKRPKSTTPSKEQIYNRSLLNVVIDKMATKSEPVTTAWLQTITGITSAQKASAIMRLGITEGKIRKAEPIKGKVTYELA